MAPAKKPEVWEKTKGKTRNLTEKQVKAGSRVIGGGRTERLKKGEGQAAVSTQLDINQTKWTTAKERGGKGRGGLLTDASGKALTGTVTLPSGAKASYVRGKRVTTAAGAARTSRASGPSGPSGPPRPPRPTGGRNVQPGGYAPGASGGTTLPPRSPRPGFGPKGKPLGPKTTLAKPETGRYGRLGFDPSKSPKENRILQEIEGQKARIRRLGQQRANAAARAAEEQRLRRMEQQLRDLRAQK